MSLSIRATIKCERLARRPVAKSTFEVAAASEVSAVDGGNVVTNSDLSAVGHDAALANLLDERVTSTVVGDGQTKGWAILDNLI